MPRTPRLLALLLGCLCLLAPAALAASGNRIEPPQETGFLNRTLVFRGVAYRFQVYVPLNYTRFSRHRWPIILFLHGRGERGSEGMWQTQVGLPQAVRDHPDRWPFLIVMPQCPQGSYWTDPAVMGMALSALDQEAGEFHADPNRTYLTGLSLGGYGAWELARRNPRRFAAIAIAAGGIFWSYAPERWRESATLPAQYARAIGHTPVWLFHGSQDHVVTPRESELMFSAFKAAGGDIRLWVYLGLHHDCWTRAYDEPELPRWLLDHRRGQPPVESAERILIPLHPPAIRLTGAQLDALAGDYADPRGRLAITLIRQGDQLYQKDVHGQIEELAAESPYTLFYPSGGGLARIAVERDPQGRITALVFRDDRFEERWERMRPPAPHEEKPPSNTPSMR
ncbi:MAG TPA: prolyl oligopeptidase family serine peptidase [Terracidiphilus sp.]|nr:prolyl oligopeptidase family serine peptidase [Terracidiphilus sp.]